MSDPQQPEQLKRPGRTPAWAGLLAVASVILMAVGVGLPLVGGGSAPHASGPNGANPTDSGLTGFAGGGMESVGDSGSPPAPSDGGLGPWGPSIFRIGFSAFVGFAVGYALRTFAKFAIAAMGFFAIALFGLEYAGLVDVKWGAMSERYASLTARVAGDARGVWDSISVLLPASASATAGLVAGFWRRGA